MKIKKIILGAAAIAAVFLTGCGVNSYSAEEYYKPYVSGYEGSGTFHMSIDSDMEERIVSECLPKDATEMEELQCYLLLETMEYDAEPNKNLSNGDKVSVKIRCNEEALADMKIKFTDTEFTYTVEGLEEAREIDLTADVTVTFEGMAPNGTAVIEYLGDDDFIKNNVTYSVGYSKDGRLSNGDVITICADYDRAVFDENNYIVTNSKKEFTVSGLDDYLREDADLSELDDIMYNYVKELLVSSENYGIGAETSGNGFFKNGSSTEKYKVLAQSVTPCKRSLISGSVKNEYAVFYRLNFTVEKISDSTKDGREKGFTGESDNLYMCVYTKNIIKYADGTIEYNADDLHYNWYGYSFLRNYVGADIEEIYKGYYYSDGRYNLDKIVDENLE